jgi:hypothetical protein
VVVVVVIGASVVVEDVVVVGEVVVVVVVVRATVVVVLVFVVVVDMFAATASHRPQLSLQVQPNSALKWLSRRAVFSRRLVGPTPEASAIVAAHVLPDLRLWSS